MGRGDIIKETSLRFSILDAKVWNEVPVIGSQRS
jgi:hypothetical protein